MKVVVAFDVDGTLEVGNPPGPIKLSELKRLKELGLVVGIVGAFEKVKRIISDLEFYYPGHPHKPKYLKEIKERYNPVIAIYVGDDDADRVAALSSGFIYVRPEDYPSP